jgi:hypothetical protein
VPNLQSQRKLVILSIIATVAAASMWFYVDRILVAYQVKDAAAHERPRGNLSDLYPRWLGARELLRHHRNPYSDDVTVEIQEGYYGRALDPLRPNDPKDQQGFAYPVYIVFLLAPFLGFPFRAVQLVFHWLLILLTAFSAELWLRILRWRLPLAGVATCVVLLLGSFPAVQGIKLQQLSLLVAALMAGSAASAVGGFLFSSGVLLALATIKPQLAWPLAAWLLCWAASDWRRRRRLVFGFFGAMIVLVGGAEVLLPGWMRMFIQAMANYHRYTQNQSVLLVPWSVAGVFVAAAVLVSAFFLAKIRFEQSKFGHATALVLALTVLVVPMFAPYNQVLLMPAVLVLAMNRKDFLSPARSRSLRFGYLATVLAVGWQWVASWLLSLASILGFSGWSIENWKLPFLTTFALPVLVFGTMLLKVYWLAKLPEAGPLKEGN